MKLLGNALTTPQLVLSILLLLKGLEISAAEISHETVTRIDGKLSYGILIKGPLAEGDAHKFAKVLLTKHPATNQLSAVTMLNSLGGDLSEAIRIGQIVRELQLDVRVMNGMTCASACFFVFLSGSPRSATGAEPNGRANSRSPLGIVGLHRPYLRSPTNTSESVEKQARAMRYVAAFLEAKLVPRRLVDAMMTRPSNDIYWLTDSDIDDLGDYPPDLEELYISKCQFDRKDFVRSVIAEKAGDLQLAEKLKQKRRDTSFCIGMLSSEAFVSGIRKLEKGWLPKGIENSTKERRPK